MNKPRVNTIPWAFLAEPTMENVDTKYFRATVGREGRPIAVVSISFFTALVVALLIVCFDSSGKVPDTIRTWQEFRIALIAPFIIVGYPWLISRSLSLYILDLEKAWNHHRGGRRIIESGRKWAPLPKDAWKKGKKRDYPRNAYYYDTRLGCMERVPVDAELFNNELIVKHKQKKDEHWYLKDAYKVFWGAGLLVLRFKTEHGPHDIVLDVSEMSKEELAELQVFLYSNLPLWCRRYEKRFFKNPFRRERREFYKHPIYDRWDYRIPLLQPKGEIVQFKTISEMDELDAG